ncbi:DNA repair protein RecO [Tenacibaculum sp. SG-28]|uniref:DNA repair protein RecO n=1 Tax=Tenacibaculum sp. SG-28 TaxID=754426 RepID=UPI0026A60170
MELVVNHRNTTTLNSIREARISHPYNTIHTSITKQSILLFLSEVLSSIIQEEEQNQSLYTYLETALIWLDTHDENANFHLVFLLNLTRFLGFYPDTSNSDYAAFNLMEGSFTNSTYDKLILKNEKLILFKRVLGINFDALNQVFFSKKERQIVLRIIIDYFELHLEGFRKPKSLDILETVFR